MNYEGPLYGKLGRRYIPLRLKSGDVDRMEAYIRQLETDNEGLRNEIGRICGDIALERMKKQIIIIQDNRTSIPNELSQTHASFKFDQS